MKNIIVIGNGMVGHQFVAQFIENSNKNESQYQLTVFGEELYSAYDRVHLSSYFLNHDVDELSLIEDDFYKKNNVSLFTNERIISINKEEKIVTSNKDKTYSYDILILATGSYPWVPNIDGNNSENCFVYRTIEDLDRIEATAKKSQSGVVIGGGLLGLEAAGALRNLNIDTHIIEFSPVLMAEQLDLQGGAILRKKIEDMGLHVHTSKNTQKIVHENGQNTLYFADDTQLTVDFIVFSTGIRPQDALAKQSQLPIGARGGVVINDQCVTSDPNIYAIGECASWGDRFFGLVAPGYKMAKVAALHILGRIDAPTFTGADMSAQLKLLGVKVGSIGDVHGRTPNSKSYTYQNEEKEIYKRLIVSENGQQLLGAVLVGDTDDYSTLLQYKLNETPLPTHPDSLILPNYGEKTTQSNGADALPDSAIICSCFDVSKEKIKQAIAAGCTTVEAIKKETKAGTGCGGCVPLLTQILNAELAKSGVEVTDHICEHFAYSRQSLFHLIKVNKIKTFDALLEKYGQGLGCEICKPTVASILSSCWNEFPLSAQNAPLQESNDAYLGNIQKDGTYSVIPRMNGGEVTPAGLIVMGQIAKEYNLYTKITGAQRIGLYGVQKNDLIDIWRTLIEAGFETGQAYARGLRMAKSCIGNKWCRYGVKDSLALGVELEQRYKGIRSPHKMKMGVSGCTRECAEAQGKDIGIIATSNGWNLYVSGNGGMKPRHGSLLGADLDKETLIKYIDRFMMFYISTADRLQRTSVWFENLDGGLEYLKDVIIHDKLGINQQLEEDIANLIESYQCEWQQSVENAETLQKRFNHFINSTKRDDNLQYIQVRDQHRPATFEEKEIK